MKRFLITKKYVADAETPEEAITKVDATEVDDMKEKEQIVPEVKVQEIPMKPTLAEIINHYKTGLPGEDPTCLVCDQTIRGPFTDLHGQIRCVDCGTTYAWMGSNLRDEFLLKNDLTRDQIAQHYCDMFEYVPLARLYWQEVHKRMPFGVYLLNNPITGDETDSFYGWLVKNADRFEPLYDGFNWSGLKREYAAA